MDEGDGKLVALNNFAGVSDISLEHPVFAELLPDSHLQQGSLIDFCSEMEEEVIYWR